MLLKDTTGNAQCQIIMDVIIIVLCGISAALSVISIVISVKGRRRNGRGKEKD